MCKVCELRSKCDKLTEELDFRIVQYQKELRFGRPQDAKDAKEYAMQNLADLFNVLDEMPAAMAEVEAEAESSSGLEAFLGQMVRQDKRH